jgi:hypothetical protein
MSPRRPITLRTPSRRSTAVHTVAGTARSRNTPFAGRPPAPRMSLHRPITLLTPNRRSPTEVPASPGVARNRRRPQRQHSLRRPITLLTGSRRSPNSKRGLDEERIDARADSSGRRAEVSRVIRPNNKTRHATHDPRPGPDSTRCAEVSRVKGPNNKTRHATHDPRPGSDSTRPTQPTRRAEVSRVIGANNKTRQTTDVTNR